MLQRFKYLIRYFLLILFLGYTAGITLFTHLHVVNGISIVHSHPFKKDIQHTHTALEFELIQMLNHYVSTNPPAAVVVFVFIVLFTFILVTKPISRTYQTPYYGLAGLRAPPFQF